MAFHITHRLGAMTRPAAIGLSSLLNELKEHPEDQEHCSVSVTHESEWCLAAYGGGYVTWENLEDGPPRHMDGVTDEKLIGLLESARSR